MCVCVYGRPRKNKYRFGRSNRTYDHPDTRNGLEWIRVRLAPEAMKWTGSTVEKYERGKAMIITPRRRRPHSTGSGTIAVLLFHHVRPSAHYPPPPPSANIRREQRSTSVVRFARQVYNGRNLPLRERRGAVWCSRAPFHDGNGGKR